MTLVIPAELEQQLVDRARVRQVNVETLVADALHWYLGLERGLIDELEAWQEVRDEALGIVEEASP